MSVFGLARLCAIVFAVGLVGRASAEPQILYSYPGILSQVGSRGPLTRGPDGTLYAALHNLGPSFRGSVVAYKPPATPGAAWAMSLIYGFGRNEDGSYPQNGVTLGPAGELYGMSPSGGLNSRGVVYRLTPPATPGDPWSKDILHQFARNQGYYPSSNLLFGPDGSLYGTALAGGSSNCGLAFRLTPKPGGAAPWSFKVLAHFTPAVGCWPRTPLIRDTAGNLYGTLSKGGRTDRGAVYRLAPVADGRYKFNKLKLFDSATGLGYPTGNIVFDGAGALIGAAYTGGGYDCGGVYRLAPPTVPGATWSYQNLRSLPGGERGGCYPLGVARNPVTGSIAVTTYLGGPTDEGTLLRLSPRASDPTQYDLSLQESFGPIYQRPADSPIMGPLGEVYGSTNTFVAIWRSGP